MSFISFLKAAGHDIKKGLDFLLPYAVTGGQVAVDIFAPGLGPMFKATTSAIVLVEQKYVALKDEKAGAKKLADVISLMGPVIAQSLADAGKENDEAAVEQYVESIVTILNSIPASPAQH